MAISLFPERDCTTCTAKQKRNWGCEGNAQEIIELDGEIMDTCIRRPLLDNPLFFNEAFELYRFYKDGFLPNEGTFLAQPLSFRQLIIIIDSALEECNSIREDSDKTKKINRNRVKKS